MAIVMCKKLWIGTIFHKLKKTLISFLKILQGLNHFFVQIVAWETQTRWEVEVEKRDPVVKALQVMGITENQERHTRPYIA